MPSGGHLVLLGDSIFDNGAYTRGEPDVVTHLRSLLPPSWSATLLAVDGATTVDVRRQLARVPDAATHLVLSVGGNDALQNSDLLRTPVRSSADTLNRFAERLERFAAAYAAALAAAVATRLPTVACTVYNGALPPGEAPAAAVALSTFNDVILRTAVAHRLDLIELRLVCTEPSDYANPIEPSGQGGHKIAAAIARAVGASDARRVSAIYF